MGYVNDPVGVAHTATTTAFTKLQIADGRGTRLEADRRLDLAIFELSTGEFAGAVVISGYPARDESTKEDGDGWVSLEMCP